MSEDRSTAPWDAWRAAEAEVVALRAQVEELKAAWDAAWGAISDEFPGPHEGWLTDTPATLLLQAVRHLKAKVEELTRELVGAEAIIAEQQRETGVIESLQQKVEELTREMDTLRAEEKVYMAAEAASTKLADLRAADLNMQIDIMERMRSISNADRERAQQAEAQVEEAVRIAGEAIGTDPSLRSVACVQVLADRAERLSQQVEELKAAWDAVADEFPGPHEGWLTDTPATLLLQAVRHLKTRVEELTLDRDVLAKGIKVLDGDLLVRAEQAEARAALLEKARPHRQQYEALEAKLAAVVEALEDARREVRAGSNGSWVNDSRTWNADRRVETALAAARDQPTQVPLGHKYARSGLTYADGESHDACAHETQGFSAMRVCGQPESAHQPTQEPLCDGSCGAKPDRPHRHGTASAQEKPEDRR